MSVVVSVEHLSKSYQLGQIGTGTFAHDLNVWWAKVRGKSNPMLRIGESNHSHRDGEVLWALKDVSFTVQQGEVLGIIGRNGAGKSTLLKILSRVTAPTNGVVKVRGRIASLLEVGTGFHPELTGRENVYLNGAILGMSRREIDRKFDEIVDFAGVEKFIDTPVKRYSSGMYVRLAFAVAAHLDPEILVVDEVLAVGDAEFQKKCLGKMGEVAQGGRTVLFVSHNMGAISQLCINSLLFAQGLLVDIGPSKVIIDEYVGGDSVSMAKKTSKVLSNTDPDLELIDFFVHQDGQTKIYYKNDRIIEVNFIYKIKKPLRNLLLGFDLINKDGTTLFRTYDFKKVGLGIRETGVYRSSFFISPNTLLDGEYFLDLVIAVHRIRWISRNQLRFVINVTREKQADVSFLGVINAPGMWRVKSC